MAPGDAVKYVAMNGEEHNALIVHVWDTTFLMNLVYVGEVEDSFGNKIVRATSVPWFEEGMKGFYVKRIEEAGKAIEEDAEEEGNIDDMGPLRKGVKETLE